MEVKRIPSWLYIDKDFNIQQKIEVYKENIYWEFELRATEYETYKIEWWTLKLIENLPISEKYE